MTGRATFGAWLRDHRKSKGIGVRELARKAGVAPSYISRIESGDRQPETDTRKAIADALGIPLDAAPSPPARKDFMRLSDEELFREFAQILFKMPGLKMLILRGLALAPEDRAVVAEIFRRMEGTL